MENNIIVTIIREEEIKLAFHFEDETLFLNLSSESTKDTQEFFLKLLKKMITENEVISLTINDEENDLYHDVCQKYIENLETEIKKIFNEFPEKLKINT